MSCMKICGQFGSYTVPVCCQVENVEAKVGRKGFVRMRGDLPIAPRQKAGEGRRGNGQRHRNAINLDIYALELRLRNSYTGGHTVYSPDLHCRIGHI